MASQAGTSLVESMRCHEVLDSFDHETSLMLDMPIFSQGGDGRLDKNLRTFHGLPDLQNVDLATLTDSQTAVSIFFLSFFLWCPDVCYENFKNLIMLFSRLATGVADLFTGKPW